MQTREFSDKTSADFRLLLQEELVKRCRANKRYSLRAFADFLKVAPSALSSILSGKRPLSLKMKKRLGLALGLSLIEIEKFIDSHSKEKSGASAEPGRSFQQITHDSYALISDWYHYAILELIRIKSFQPSTEWISKALGITKSEANIAVERLQRLGLLEIDEKGRWTDTSTEGMATNIQGELTSAGSKKLQQQVLEMSLEALHDLPLEVRNHTSMTMAIHPEDLKEAKNRIKKFRRELCDFLERNQKPTQVYQLGISLYPLTKITDGGSREKK